jgi:DNA ligase-1
MTFSELATYFQKLEQTPSRNEMTVILADLFKKAPTSEIGKIVYLLQGRVVPLYEAIEFGVADKFMIRAIAQGYEVTPQHVLSAFKKHGDLGEAAELVHSLKRSKDQKLTISEVYQKLYTLATTGGVGSQEKKITILADIFSEVDALSARYIARIPLDKLRLGFSDMTMLDSLSWMLAGDKSLRPRLEEAYNVRPDIGYIAQQVKESGIKGLSHVKAKVGAPILASLCQRLPTADEMIEKMAKVFVEPKYDGERVQIHIKKKGAEIEVKTFSRNLENTTAMFPELTAIGKQVHADEVILDSEAVGLNPKTGAFISFQETMTRKRKHHIAETQLLVPLKFVVFDVLYKDGSDLLATPLYARKKILTETIVKADGLMISPHIVTEYAQEIRAYHDEQLKKGLEGVVVKKWESGYEPGRRGFSWVKFKEEEGKTGKLTDTIDAVVMGYYLGQGKRTTFGIGAFLVGVIKGDGFVTVTKIGTGVSDELWKELRTRLQKIKVKDQPKQYEEVNKLFTPDVWVEPKIVVELAGDDLTKSPSHGAGVAVRFPRLVRIRDDKSPAQATTVKEMLQMYKNQ